MIFQLLEDYHTYRPQKEVDASNFPESSSVGFFDCGSDKLQYLFVKKPGPNLILQCHGNAANIGTLSHFYRIYEELGFSYFIFDYPGYGNSSGKPSEESLCRSLESAIKFVTDSLNYPPEKILLHGISLGGAVAIDGLSKYKLACSVLDCTFTSNQEMARVIFPYLPLNRIIPLRYNSVEKIKNVYTPILFIAAERDCTCPPYMTRELFRNKPAEKEYYEIPEATHTNHLEVAGTEYLRRFREFAVKYL